MKNLIEYTPIETRLSSKTQSLQTNNNAQGREDIVIVDVIGF